MKTNDASSSNPIHAGWQILGELELPAMAGGNDRIHSWLTELLEPFHLHMDVLHRLLKSAQDGATNALQADPGTQCEHIHLRVFVPGGRSSTGQSWGFYRIGRNEDVASDEGNYDHAIEFFLYYEG